MTNHLLIFTIGPVQSFIAQARKTQDLFAGSKLLSDLIECAVKALPQGSEVIFPAKNIQSKPNRFLAVINNADLTIGKAIEKTVKDKFLEITNNSYGNKPLNFDDQIKNFLDINWVILPYDEKDYQAKYKKIEKTLGAIKNVREFNQLDELGRKCSLCGERNVLFYHPTKGKNGNDKKPAHIQEDAVSIIDNKLTAGEGLCAVCFTKRFYSNAGSFPSTAKIALLDTIEELKKSGYSSLLKPYEEEKYDEQLIYEENLTEKYFEKFGLNKEDLKKLTENHKKIIEVFKNIENDKKLKLKLNKYYAIIALDGDNMGKWLSGEYLDDEGKKKLKAFHNQMSEKLGKYADQVKKEIFKDNKGTEGALIYAGGDDVLAFVNLNHLTNVLKNLRTNFPVFGGTEESSASCGVAIAHYKIPLGEVLKRARKMEKAAKDKGDRNAFGIAVLKHSGEIEESVFEWGDNQANIDLLGDLIGYLKKEEFSNTFIKSLNVELHKLMDNEGKINNPKADDIIKIELQRLLERSRDKNKDITKVQAKELADKIYKLYESKSDDVQNFLSFLNIADFLHREVNK